MTDELTELLDMAIYKEIASQAIYLVGQSRTEDPGAKTLLKDLVEAESEHARRLREFKEEGLAKPDWHREGIANLRIGEYLTGSDMLNGAGLQDTLIFAIKREQQSLEFYSKLMSVLGGEAAKHLCGRLAREELRHKLKLELFYDDLFYGLEEARKWR